MLRIGHGAVYFPTQRVLVGDGGSARCVDVVFSYAAATDDGFHGRCRTACLGIFRIDEHIVGLLHFQIARSELCADAFEVFFRVQRAGMAEAAFRVVPLNDTLVVEHETGGGRQCGFCGVEGCQLVIDGGLVDPSFVDQRLRHVDFVLENGDGGCRIG